ncbi:MAG: site-2 protease family protein [Ignavibacteriales bacterium]|nr:site-2 protease family protein [Ignavibacteriales bacterium]
MSFLTTVFYFLITIGILVLVHELGHFFAAKFFGMRVDRFSIGFPPRAFGKKIGETDYCISWIPIGGYVKIAGMVDESFDTEFINQDG